MSKHHKYEWYKLTAEDVLDMVNILDKYTEFNEFKVPTEVIPLPKFKEVIKEPKPQIDTIHPTIKRDRSNQIEATTKHGKSGTAVYNAWQSMKSKPICCKEWKDSFDTFYEDIGKDRTDTNKFISMNDRSKGYVKGNVYWGTTQQPILTPVSSIDSDGGKITYESVKAACEATGATTGHIVACCKGKRSTHKGYGWEYAA